MLNHFMTHIFGDLCYQLSTFDVFPNYLIKEIPCFLSQTFCLYIQFYDILPPATSKATIISFMVPLFWGVQLRMSLYGNPISYHNTYVTVAPVRIAQVS